MGLRAGVASGLAFAAAVGAVAAVVVFGVAAGSVDVVAVVSAWRPPVPLPWLGYVWVPAAVVAVVLLVVRATMVRVVVVAVTGCLLVALGAVVWWAAPSAGALLGLGPRYYLVLAGCAVGVVACGCFLVAHGLRVPAAGRRWVARGAGAVAMVLVAVVACGAAEVGTTRANESSDPASGGVGHRPARLDGSVRWSVAQDPVGYAGTGVATDGGFVHVYGSMLTATDPVSGKQRWRYVAGGRQFVQLVAAGDGSVVAVNVEPVDGSTAEWVTEVFDARTGERLARFPTPVLGARIAAVERGAVLFYDDDEMLRYRMDGSRVWRHVLSCPDRYPEVDVTRRGILVHGWCTEGGGVVLLDRAKGRELWRTHLPGQVNRVEATLARDVVFVAAAHLGVFRVSGFDLATGRRLWTSPVRLGTTKDPDDADVMALRQAGGRVVLAGLGDGVELAAFDPVDGRRAWRRTLPVRVVGDLSSVVVTRGGTVMVFHEAATRERPAVGVYRSTAPPEPPAGARC